MKLRLSIALFLILAVAVLPWWLIAIFAIWAMNKFPWYYEAIAAAFVYDLLYSLPVFYFSFWSTLIFVLLVPIFEWLKKKLYVFA